MKIKLEKGPKVTTITGKAAREMIPFIGDGKGFHLTVRKVKGVEVVEVYTG